MNTLNPTTQSLIAQLNALVAPMINTRVYDFGVFHGNVSNAVNPFLRSLGLHYMSWRVKESNSHESELLTLEIEFKDDKGWKQCRWGRLLGLKFTALADGQTVSDLRRNVRANKLRDQIADLEATAEKRLTEINGLRKCVEDYKAELTKLTQP